MANSKKNKKVINDEINTKEGIIVVIVLIGIVLVIYGLTIGAQKLGLFNVGYTKPEISNAVINYDNILAGTIFSRQSGEYYVAISEFDNESSIYLNSLISQYNEKENKLNLYKVNLKEGLNKNIIGSSSNVIAQDVASLKINGPTLIKIKDGKNIKYIEGEENIKIELGI